MNSKMRSRTTLLCAIACCFTAAYAEEKSNLPFVPEGFNASTRIEISAPVEKVWNTILDFPSYPNWNPFVRHVPEIQPAPFLKSVLTNSRSSVIVDDEDKPLPLEAQVPQEGRSLRLEVQLPPLPMPVKADTPGVYLNGQTAHVNITDVLPTRGRIAWAVVDLPSFALSSKRWSSVLDLGNGKTLYESREVFYGAAVPVLKFVMESKLNEGFNAQAKALKVFCEDGK
jgi:hypothetical protein